MAEVQSTFLMAPGETAPEFTLPDANGATVSRSGVAGPNGLLVVFACNHCPFVEHLADSLGALARDLAAQGIGTVAINSNDVEHYPQDAPGGMAQFATVHGWGFPYLVDESQAVAKAYRAACTPDFFLLDAESRLAYAGQFDDTRPHSGTAHGGDLREAARRMLAGESPLPRPYPSSGCNIKWKPGTEPDWAPV